MKLSVLDQSVACAGRSEADAIRDTLSLAPFCEALGYQRFWLSEHHGLPGIVGTAPEVLMAAIAARTERIRIGSAGVMLPHYSALKVAEQFRVLEALAPGRIDLGVGRAPGGDRRTAQALNPHARAGAEDFPEQVQDLQAWSRGVQHRGIVAHPRGGPFGAPGGLKHAPQLWILGSLRLRRAPGRALRPAVCVRLFLHGRPGRRTGTRALPQPVPAERAAPAAASHHLRVGAGGRQRGRCAPPGRQPRARWRADYSRGRLGPLLPPDEVAARGFSEEERPAVEAGRRKAFVGTPRQVADKLRGLAAALELDELVINTWAHAPAVRRHSYALLAQEFGVAQSAEGNGIP